MNKQLLSQIANYLMMNASFQDDLSLYHGKMGCVLFFAHYSRYVDQLYYADFASELLNEIYDDLNEHTPVGFEYGLCGIGWGIEHLVQQNFTQGDTGYLLEDLNLKVMEYNPLRIQDMSFNKGLKGIAYYVMTHIKSPYSKTKTIDSLYLLDLDMSLKNNGLSPMCYPQMALSLPEELFQDRKNLNIMSELKLSTYPLGIVDGLAGIGLKMMGL